jgi:hypothetical protein
MQKFVADGVQAAGALPSISAPATSERSILIFEAVAFVVRWCLEYYVRHGARSPTHNGAVA